MQSPAQLALASCLEQKISALSQRCTAAMYEDPFWQARFGDRGRRYAEEDSGYHVKYVVSALRADDVGLFRRYAQWLRGVLVARGMCSFHLAESFRQLTLAMQAEAVTDFEVAASILAEGSRALRYETGEAGEMDACSEAVRAAIGTYLRNRTYRLDELISFTADSLASGETSSIGAHIAFLDSSLVGDDAERVALYATLAALKNCAQSLLSPETSARVATLVDSARPQ